MSFLTFTYLRVEVRDQPVRVSPFLELCEFQELNAGCQAWQQAPAPARAPRCPACIALNTH